MSKEINTLTRLGKFWEKLRIAGFSETDITSIIEDDQNYLAQRIHNTFFNQKDSELTGISNDDFSLVYERKLNNNSLNYEDENYAVKAWNLTASKKSTFYPDNLALTREFIIRGYNISNINDSMLESKINEFASKHKALQFGLYGLAYVDLRIGLNLPKNRYILSYGSKISERLDSGMNPLVPYLFLKERPCTVKRGFCNSEEAFWNSPMFPLFFTHDPYG